MPFSQNPEFTHGNFLFPQKLLILHQENQKRPALLSPPQEHIDFAFLLEEKRKINKNTAGIWWRGWEITITATKLMLQVSDWDLPGAPSHEIFFGFDFMSRSITKIYIHCEQVFWFVFARLDSFFPNLSRGCFLHPLLWLLLMVFLSSMPSACTCFHNPVTSLLILS